MTEKIEAQKLVAEIMQSGFDVAMGGNVFNSEQENAEWQNSEFDRTVKKYAKQISKLQSQLLIELIKEIEKQKIGTFKGSYKATKEYGGTKEEWSKLNNRGHDRVLDDVIQLLKSKFD